MAIWLTVPVSMLHAIQWKNYTDTTCYYVKLANLNVL